MHVAGAEWCRSPAQDRCGPRSRRRGRGLGGKQGESVTLRRSRRGEGRRGQDRVSRVDPLSAGLWKNRVQGGKGI
jgi:hypothetical protein